MGAAHFDVDWRLSARLRGITTLRFETLAYDYDNRFLTGNSKPDGTACLFGGCLFHRPADRRDRFNNLAGRVGLQYQTGTELQLYVSAAQGFRPPQATELYRLQNSQSVADLDSENLLSLEAGGRDGVGPLRYQVTLFFMNKSNVILRDAQGFTISDGKTRHWGWELDGWWQADARNQLRLTFSHARHSYRFHSDAALGEEIRSGNEVDTAPRHLGRIGWFRELGASAWVELESIYLGSYALDAANAHRYPGHSLLNLRAGMRLSDNLGLRWTVTNLTDRAYAERADFAFGEYRYFPGRSRRFMFSLDARW